MNTVVPGLSNVNNVDTVSAGLPEVGLHVHLKVLGTEVALGSQEHLDVLAGGVHGGGKISGGHLDWYDLPRGMGVEVREEGRSEAGGDETSSSVAKKFATVGERGRKITENVCGCRALIDTRPVAD